MLVRTIFSSIAIATIARADNQNHNAPIATNNPEGAAFVAMLPNRQDTTIRGNITAITASDGKGVQFALDIEGLPMEGGPFRTFNIHSTICCSSILTSPPAYHIHDQPVPPDGNCTGTLAHLDPFGRGEMPPCDGTSPATCQVGDLAGKHGMLEAPTYADR